MNAAANEREETYGFLVLMTMTPLAPRLPYIDVLTASFRTSIFWMSYGLTPASAPPGPGVMGTPSRMYSG